VPKNSKSDIVSSQNYLMESEDEAIRLEVKTDPAALHRQALWCGIKPGMRVLDAGCGPGKTTALLYEMIQPEGSIVGIDFSETRIAYAQKHYGGKKGIEFYRQDLNASMTGLGEFDFIWVRFVLEYFRRESLEIVGKLKNCLKPGGTLCLIDLDYNCLIYYEMPEPLQSTLAKIMMTLDEQYNFDTFVGRKLYSFLYDVGLENINVELMAHNLIYGEIKDKDKFNVIKKIETVLKKVGSVVKSYPGGYDQFYSDFTKYVVDARRFTYTPLLLCKGTRSVAD
jgi:ubiquinone/menaquinone biosynthesis C-methylase UbiE